MAHKICSPDEENNEKFNLLDSILHGKTHRQIKKATTNVLEIPQKPSPFHLPFDLCRAKQLKKKKQRQKCDCTPKKTTPTKISLLQKSVMSQVQYDNLLATPRSIVEPKVKKKKKQCPCELEPCSPRLVQLAVPTKVRVLSTWTSYQDYLSTESIIRLEEILLSDQNIEPKDARYYYKKLDKLKQKAKRRKLKMKMKKQKRKLEESNVWIEEHITDTCRAILNFLKEEPLFNLNYKQLMISNVILCYIERTGICRKPKRDTKSRYGRTLVEISEKLAMWIDTVTKFVDVQAVESEEDIAPIRFPSYLSFGYEEEEEEGEEEEVEVEEQLETAVGYEENEDYIPLFKEETPKDGASFEDFRSEIGEDMMFSEVVTEMITEHIQDNIGDCEDDLLPKPKKLTMLEKTIMSQEEYMNWLATPIIRYQESSAKPRKVKKCDMSPCPPRFVQLAIPSKRIILSNWSEYQNSLPVEVLLRFQQILHADQNLELRDADYYYRKLEKMEKKSARKKKRLTQKKLMDRERGKYAWIEDNLSATVKAIMNFLKEEPLFSLNYKQLLLSDEILNVLDKKHVITKPSRSTKCTFKRCIIETSDKLAVWMDTLTKFVDVQGVESDEDIPPISISSLEVEGEEEMEEEAEESEEEEMKEEIFIREEGEEIGYGEDFGEDFGEDYRDEEIHAEEKKGTKKPTKTKKPKKTKKTSAKEDIGGQLDEEYEFGEEYMEEDEYGEGTGEDGTVKDEKKKKKKGKRKIRYEETEEGIDADLLKRLIQIYEERSPEDYLANEVGKVPGYTYEQILNKMKEITVEDDGPKKSKLEEAMIEWLTDVAPDEVNENTLKAIHEYACALLEELKKAGYGENELDKILQGEETDQGEEADQGEDGETELENLIQGEDTDNQLDKTDQEQVEDAGVGLESTDKLMQQEEGEGWEQGVVDEVVDEDIGAGFVAPEEEIFEGEADIIYEKLEVPKPEIEEGDYIRGHKPPKVYEHSPDAICCLSLKIWAVWLLEVIHNAHMWTKWMHGVIRKVREFASIVRGDVKCLDGKRQVLYKSEWRSFVKETEAKIVAWRQYSAHVKELSDGIIENFRNKKVFCCPKCLQDHLIKNVVTAHQTLAALTEAMNCAQYWRRCLDGLVQTASSLTSVEEKVSGSEESSEADEIEELSIEDSSSTDDDGIFEFEELQRKEGPKR